MAVVAKYVVRMTLGKYNETRVEDRLSRKKVKIISLVIGYP